MIIIFAAAVNGIFDYFSYRILFLHRREALHAIDARTKVMREVISGIRIVKMYTSEDFVRQLIGDLRWYVCQVYHTSRVNNWKEKEEKLRI